MANEANVSSGLQITSGNLQYRSLPTTFRADVAGPGGPTPGAFAATEDGTDVDLSALTSPGLCRIQNLDETYYIEVGVWNPDQSEFYPVLRLLPGESYVVRLSPEVNEEYSGTGTLLSAQQNTLRVKAQEGSGGTTVLVEAFDS